MPVKIRKIPNSRRRMSVFDEAANSDDSAAQTEPAMIAGSRAFFSTRPFLKWDIREAEAVGKKYIRFIPCAVS